MTNNVQGKIVLITGANVGIGKSCAMKFAENGANLILNIRNKENAENTKKDILELYPNTQIHLLICDVRDRITLKEEVKNIPKEFENIDILINNAGLARGVGKVFDITDDDMDTMIDTNIKGLVSVTKEIVPKMIERNSGHIINIGSTAGQSAYVGGGVYSATKSSVKFLSDALRLELIATPLKVTNVQPGMVETNFSITRFHGDKDKADNVYKGFEPLTPDDVADSVFYVANTPENVQITEITVVCKNQADGRTVHKTNL